MSSWVRSVIGGVVVAAFAGFGPAAQRAEATPVVVAEYVETNLGGGNLGIQTLRLAVDCDECKLP